MKLAQLEENMLAKSGCTNTSAEKEETPVVAKKRELKSKSKLIKSVLKRARVSKSDQSGVDEEKEKREKLMAQAYETIMQSCQ